MNENHRLLFKKREICQPYMIITDTDLARALQKKVIERDPLWKYLGGFYPSSGWGAEGRMVTIEEFITTYDHKAMYNNDLFCTYDKCIDLDLISDHTDDTGIEFVKITIYNGGGRGGIRCTLFLDGPWWTIKAFQDRIEQRWHAYTGHQVYLEDEARKERRRQEISAGILAGTYEVNKEE